QPNSVSKTEAGFSSAGLPGSGVAAGSALGANGSAVAREFGASTYNTYIEKGTRSGGGYSGGVNGYSRGNGSADPGTSATAAKKPFSLRDFLPGARKDPKRKIAGVAAAKVAHPEIAAAHSDIFKR